MTRKMMRSRMRFWGLGVFAVFSATVVSFLSFISVELAVAVFALSSVAFIVMLERARRANWEQAVDFKFKTMGKSHHALERKVARHSDILDETVKNIRRASVPFETIKENKKTAPPPKPLKVPQPANLPKDELLERHPKTIKVIEDSDSLSDMVVEELTGHALKHKRIDIFIQPIMRLPQRQRKFYEVFSRVRAKPGVYIPAERYLKLAEKNDQIRDIDALILAQCLEIVQQCSAMENMPSFFINITATTLKNGQFMNKLLAFLSKNRDLAARLVFEMKQEEFHDLPVPVLQIIGGLAKLGCSFSLDHVKSLEEDITDLQRFRVRYLKVDAAIFTKAAKEDRSYKALMKLKRLLEGNGVGVIAERIENEEIMRGLLDYDLRYGQGYLFGRPDLQAAYEPELQVKRR